MRNALLFGVVLLVAGAAQLYWASANLPERIATHFDLHGQPDGWSSRAGALWLQGVLLAGVPGFFVFLAWLVPRLPLALVNVPHKDYWFAPERRTESWRFVQGWLAWMADLTLFFFLVLFQESCRVNLAAGEEGLGGLFWVALGLFVAATLAMVVWLYRRFGPPPAAGGASSGP